MIKVKSANLASLVGMVNPIITWPALSNMHVILLQIQKTLSKLYDDIMMSIHQLACYWQAVTHKLPIRPKLILHPFVVTFLLQIVLTHGIVL